MADNEFFPIEWETSPDFHAGTELAQRSIDKMKESSDILRQYVVGRVESTDPYGVSPKARSQAKRTVARFNAFRRHILNHSDLTKPVLTEDIMAFIEVLPKIIEYNREGGRPSLRTIHRATKHVSQWAQFTYGHLPDFKIRKEKIKATIQGLIRDKIVCTGPSSERTSIFSTLHRMA